MLFGSGWSSSQRLLRMGGGGGRVTEVLLVRQDKSVGSRFC